MSENLDWSHIRLTYATPLYLNQDNADEVFSLFREYANKLPADLLEQILFVVVDDASPTKLEIPSLPINMIVLRVGEDIPWNNPGARNLAVVAAKSDKVFLTDIDHELDEKTFRKFLRMENPGKTLWRLKRFFAGERVRRKPHANSFLLSRGYFLKHYGYDEDFCGSYASDDVHFVKYFKYHGARVVTIMGDYKMISRGLTKGGKYTHSLDRDKTRNRKLKVEKLAQMKTYGPEAGHSRNFLNFTWQVAYTSQRKPQNAPKQQKCWYMRWWLRNLWPWD